MSPTLLIILAAVVVLIMTGAIGFHLIARLRAQEAAGSDPASPASDDSLSEMRDIGQRIETLVSQQQEQGETQRQRLAQQIDTVQQTVGEQRVLVDGLRSEMRHDAKRRDHELDDIRTQIASIQQSMPALTGGTHLALPEPADETSSSVELAPEDTATDALVTDVTPDTPQEDTFAEVTDPFAFDLPEAPETEISEIEAVEIETFDAFELADDLIANESIADAPVVEAPIQEAPVEADDSWAITPDWSEAAVTEAVSEDAEAPEIAAEEVLDIASETFDAATPVVAAEMQEIAEEPVDAATPEDMDVFADVSTFDIAPAPATIEAQTPEAWDVAPEPNASSMEPEPHTMEPDASAMAAPADESLFEELKIEEMSFHDMSFGEPETDAFAFDPDEAALEIDDIESALADLMPGAPSIDEPVASTDAEPEASIFMDALVPNELAIPEPVVLPEAGTELMADATPEAAPSADADPIEDDIFAATSFLEADDAVPTTDPLAFEEMFVPTPVDTPHAEAASEDVFASWSPSSFETSQPAETAPPALAFAEAPTEVPSEALNEPQAGVSQPTVGDSQLAPVDLSSFEDWGLDPEPVAAPAEPQTWAPPGSPSPAADAWATAPPVAPTPAPQAPAPQAPATDAPPAPESHATAWVVRNGALQPSAEEAADMEPPAISESMPVYEAPAYDEPLMVDETPTYETAGFDAPPVMAAAPMIEAPSIAVAPESVDAPPSAPVSEPPPVASPVVETAPEPASEPTPEPAPEPQPLAEGVERLSILPSIDDDLERALHLAGVTTLDDMARWGRTEARRIAAEVGVSEDTVLNHWVFEAQTALFERFTQQVGA